MGRGSSGISTGAAGQPGGSAKFKKTLKLVEDGIKGNKVESAICVDANGNILFNTSDNAAQSVAFTPAQVQQAYGQTLTHNHPHGYYFSKEDINAARVMNLKQLRATTPDGRVFVLEHTAPGAQTGALYRAYVSAMNSTAQQATAQAVANAPMTALGNQKQLNHLISLEHTKILNHWLTDNAKNYGFEFREEKIK